MSERYKIPVRVLKGEEALNHIAKIGYVFGRKKTFTPGEIIDGIRPKKDVAIIRIIKARF